MVKTIADASFSFLRYRRAGPCRRMGRMYNGRTVRMGGLPDEGFRKTLARRPALARYTDTYEREFL